MSEEFVFRPSKKPEPHAPVRPEINSFLRNDLPLEHKIEPFDSTQASIKQQVEPSKTRTCYPASVINGLIYQGYVSHDTGLKAHQSLAENTTLFSPVSYGDQVLYFYNSNVKPIIDSVGIEIKVAQKVIQYSLPNHFEEELQNLTLSLISQNIVVVAGDPDHAVLVTGYNAQNSLFETVNARNPGIKETRDIKTFSQQVKSNPNLTLIMPTQTTQ